MKHTAEEICKALNIDIKDVLNIYPYGSQVYGTATEDSDSDYVIVYKRSLLPSGAFKDNAISSEDRMIQGSCYSRAGFLDALDNYQISALECINLPEDMVIKNTMKFKMRKYNEKEFVKKIITTASASAHNGKLACRDENIESSKKQMYHAIRILKFGRQLKNEQIIRFDSCNDIKDDIYNTTPYDFGKWWQIFLSMSENLKK